jgi:fructose-1,6-bisphosphatase II
MEKNLTALAKALNRDIEDLVVVILDRERHEELVADVRKTGARAKLVPDGDLMPCIAACARGTGVHMLVGSGGAPEGVIAAAAVRILGGYMQTKFWAKDAEEEQMMKKAKVDPEKIYTADDLAPGKNLIFCATGVTDGDVLKGVRFFGGGARTHSLVIASQSNKIRFVDTTHIFDKKEINYRL